MYIWDEEIAQKSGFSFKTLFFEKISLQTLHWSETHANVWDYQEHNSV